MAFIAMTLRVFAAQHGMLSTHGIGGLTMRLIDADELKDTLKKLVCNHCPTTGVCASCSLGKFLYVVDSAPTIDAVPVVRCKDCARRGEEGCPMMFWERCVAEHDYLRWYEYVPHDQTDPNGFCHMGRRADDGQD